ncbi:MAG: TRAP transporter large permease subunit [Pseudomonadota bacterium]
MTDGFCLCAAAGWLDLAMVATLCVALLAGYPAAFSLAGVAILFSLIGLAAGVFDPGFLKPLPQRLFGSITNQTLIAVPMFILMGVILEKAKIAEELLDEMAKLFGSMRGGLGFSVTVVGALLAASTGIVGATVVTMGLLSLPTMLRRGYDPGFAAGSIAAAGTLGQIIPPSIVLILLGDVISNAYQKAQLEQGVFAPETVSVGDLFAGALIPGLTLVALYIAWQAWVAATAPNKAPAIPAEEIGDRSEAWRGALRTLPAPLALIIGVLGSILAGIATPTEAASVGAIGALLIAGSRIKTDGGAFISQRTIVFASAASLVLLLLLAARADLRLEAGAGATKTVLIAIAALFSVTAFSGVAVSARALFAGGVLGEILDQTARVTTMVFTILMGAALFSLVFRGLGGDETVRAALEATPGGLVGAIAVVMLVMFVLGFFLDFIEITFVVVPLVGPPLLAMGVDPVWLGVMMAINLQTSFLTPPFGFALFYLRGVAPESVRTIEIYRGVIPFIGIQIIMLGLLALAPSLATWLPDLIYG